MAGAILSRRFQKLICNFRGRRTTSEVSCCVFFMTPLSGLRGVDTRCKFRGRYGILCMRCDENWRKPRTKHWFWGSTCLKFMSKLVGKRRFWSYKVWNLEEVSHEMLMLPRVSSRVSGFPVASLRLWGSCKTSPFRRLPSTLSCRFAGVALACILACQQKRGMPLCAWHHFRRVRERGVNFSVWSVKCRGRSVKRRLWCKVWNAKSSVWSVKCQV